MTWGVMDDQSYSECCEEYTKRGAGAKGIVAQETNFVVLVQCR